MAKAKTVAQIQSGLSDALWNNPKYNDTISKKFWKERAQAVIDHFKQSHEHKCSLIHAFENGMFYEKHINSKPNAQSTRINHKEDLETR